MELQLGLNSFGEVATSGGVPMTDAETLRLLVDEARLAERVGLDVFSVGEHYRAGHNDSATPVLLAAIATATERIGLGTSVTVLSTNDPVRLYHEFSTLDAVSNGRAQLVLGRASATESFPLFGYDLADYERLFEEKLDLFVRLEREESVTWSGSVRAPLHAQTLHPRMREGGIPTWIGVGGSPDSVIRAARYGLPLMLAIIGGRPQRFAGHVELYHRALEQWAHAPGGSGQRASAVWSGCGDQAAAHDARLLVVHDRADRVVPVVAARAIEAGWPGPARVMITEDRGHNRILAAPEVLTAVAAFATDPDAAADPDPVAELVEGSPHRVPAS